VGRDGDWPHAILDDGDGHLIYCHGGLNEAVEPSGVVNAWAAPTEARVDMLTTGVRTPAGIKVLGANPNKIQEIGGHIEMALRIVDLLR
jgi:Cu/Ag efflux pump CusA